MKFITSFYVCFALLAAVAIQGALAAACTEEELAAPDDRLFRITGGDTGPYEVGTSQVLSTDRPTGSNVISVNGLQIVGGATTASISSPAIPVSYALNQPDTASAFYYQVPDVPAGTYLWRLTLGLYSGGTCTLDSDAFSVLNPTGNECTFGSSQCVGATARQECNEEGTYEDPVDCAGGQVCVQNGNTATCTLQTGNGPCTFGETRCVNDGSSFQYCEYNEIGALVWRSIVDCGTGTSCITTNTAFGTQCVLTTDTSCSPGQQRCSTDDSAVETCVNGTFETAEECTGGTVCLFSGGEPICTLQSVGTDCTPGTMVCSGDTTYQQCLLQADGSGRLSGDRPCSTGTTCQTYQDDYIICA